MKDVRQRLSGSYVWKKSFELALAIYRQTAHFPVEEKYGMSAQLRRAGVSIPSNIAQWQGRDSRGEFLHHLIARGSLKEVETQLLIARALGYLKLEAASKMIETAAEIGKLINGLLRSLRRNSSASANY